MTKKHIHTYFLDQMVAFEDNLIMSAFMGEKAIHQLRLSIKKLRTLMDLIQEFLTYPEEYGYQFKRLTSIFKSLGAIRDNRNKAKMIEYYFSNEVELKEKLIYDLNEKWKQSKEMYMGKYIEFSLESFFRFKTEFGYYLKTQSKPINDHTVFKDRHDQIIDLINRNNLRGNLHKIRSFVKELLFLLQISNAKKIAFNGNTYVTKDLASLGELIGQWHDYELLINLYKEVKDELHKATTNEYGSIVQKSDELFDYVSDKLLLQFKSK
jgi:CHAD domain-containing protein